MKRNTFKKGYMILHFAVAVSIVLIGIKVLIGFGSSTYKGAKVVKDKASYQIDKIEDGWKDYKKKKNIIQGLKKSNNTWKRIAKLGCQETISLLNESDMNKCIERKLNNTGSLIGASYQESLILIKKWEDK